MTRVTRPVQTTGPGPSLVTRLGNLLAPQAPVNAAWLKAWLEIAREVETFGDALPAEWQRATSPSAMVHVLAHTRLVQAAALTTHKFCGTVPADYFASEGRDGRRGRIPVNEKVPYVRLVDLAGKVVEVMIDMENPVKVCDAIRAVVPVVAFADLRAPGT